MDITPFEMDCVVTTARMPQDAPLQPEPESAQLRAVEGFDPGAGVRVAAITPEAPEARVDGAESWSEKLLVMVIVADARWAGSAMLCAVSVTVVALGRIWGAV